MKKICALVASAIMTLGVCGIPGAAMAYSDFYEPVRANSLRMPAVPIILSDPFFSIWSPTENLYDSSTMHWCSKTKAIEGSLRVDGKLYRFMGNDDKLMAYAPTAADGDWTAKYVRVKPDGNWTAEKYDDSSWKTGAGAFGDSERNYAKTAWNGDNTDVYVRRAFEIPDIKKAGKVVIKYSHDDVFELYINGEKVIDTGNTWLDDQSLVLTSKQIAKLHKGTNVIAAHCHNTVGGAYADFGIYYQPLDETKNIMMAQQTSCTVTATSTYYTFKCGPVRLNLVFTAPQLIDDLDLLSTPINYVSYKVTASDGKSHDVQLMLKTSPQLATNKGSEPTVSTIFKNNGQYYIKSGTILQPYCATVGDQICQDWGYLYLTANASSQQLSINKEDEIKRQFVSSGKVTSVDTSKVMAYTTEEMPSFAFVDNIGSVTKKSPKSGFTMIGYDDVYSIMYLYELHKAYWTHNGQVTILDAFNKLRDGYNSIMQRCRDLDARIYDDAFKAGGKQYAEICSGAYRQVISAHKLFTDDKGRLLWFSKENNSNGCVNTVDLTYPSAPLFLLYNPELEKGMMTSIFESSLSGRWNKPFPQHDMGTYPQANGQIYGGDMPIEEDGNMIILAAEICRIEGSTNYVKPYWSLLKKWADYLVENGQDPANQLCTDDFAGHWAHNANLSVKAIMGVAGYALMCKIDGRAAEYDKYISIASKMAKQWERDAADGDHYRLAFDRSNTWSQKYNLVWDKMWGTNLFSKDVMEKEIKYYLTKQNTYGLPLDCRQDYTKSDWIMWSATMAEDNATFEKFVEPVYKFYNETTSRVPMSDWFQTKTPVWVSFRARSVIGGFWMKVLMDKELSR